MTPSFHAFTSPVIRTLFVMLKFGVKQGLRSYAIIGVNWGFELMNKLVHKLTKVVFNGLDYPMSTAS